MDLLRRCYRTKARFRAGELPVPIRWYWCDEGALLLPFPTVFNSNAWRADKDSLPAIGEIVARPVYVDGENKLGLAGICHKGAEKVYLEGIDSSSPIIPTPVCCVPLHPPVTGKWVYEGFGFDASFGYINALIPSVYPTLTCDPLVAV